jgi:hypothetical protein
MAIPLSCAYQNKGRLRGVFRAGGGLYMGRG